MRAEQVEIPVTVRADVGKIASRRLRAAGQIPAVVYGHGAEPVAVSVNADEFSQSLAGRHSALITLLIEGAAAGQDRATVMIKELKQDLVDRRFVSIDFQRVSLEEMIQTRVLVRHIGESPGVKLGGIVDQILHDITVECLPTDMPDHLEVDISALDIGDSIRVRDLSLPSGVTAIAPEDDVVIVIAPPVREEALAPGVSAEGALLEEMAEPEVIGAEERSGESEE